MQIQVRLLGADTLHHPVQSMTPSSATSASSHSLLIQRLAKQDLRDHTTFLNYVHPSACKGTQNSPSVSAAEDNITEQLSTI